MNKNQQNNSFTIASWFIFVPLVILIFIMTILSVAGFLILILNSSNYSTPLDKKTQLRNLILRANSGNENNEILEILRLKMLMKNKKKETNYKPEPEPEGILMGN